MRESRATKEGTIGQCILIPVPDQPFRQPEAEPELNISSSGWRASAWGLNILIANFLAADKAWQRLHLGFASSNRVIRWLI